MCEPAPSAQPLTQQTAEQVDGDGTGTESALSPVVFVHPSPDGDGAPHPDGLHKDGHRSLHAELEQLRRAMQTRPIIDQACGVLIATFGLSPQGAWNALVTTSQNTNTKLHRLAGDLVGTAQGDPLPKAVREQLNAAVDKAKATPSPPGPKS